MEILLNISCSDYINICVRHFRNLFFALAAFLWLPAAAHCQIEALTGQALFPCDGVQQAAGSPCSDCAGGACCPVEKSQYQAGQFRVSLPAPALFSVLIVAVPPADQAPATESASGILTAAPPQLLKTWHFLSRTALPVRAPSFVS
jgi:hypothetical protein